VFNV
jgi:hypothetical protein